jgi:hypothetical protein
MSGAGRVAWLAFALAVGYLPPGLSETIILASSRSGGIDFIDPNTLQTEGRLFAGKMVEQAVASADGTTLFITRSRESEPNGCCALFAFNLKSGSFRELLWPSTSAVLVPRLNELVTQRGNIGIEVFDSDTLLRRPTIGAPGVYGLYPSPDGHWLLGTNTFRGATLDIFDLRKSRMLRSMPVPTKGTLSGTWLGESFYLYAHFQGRGRLWRVSVDQKELDAGLPVDLPGVNAPDIALWSLVGANGHLLLYENFGTKLDRRSSFGAAPSGGVYEVDRTDGTLISSLAPDSHFSMIRVDPLGTKIFGIDVMTENWTAVRLVKIDRKSGQLDAARELTSDVWSISLAEISPSLIPPDQN